MLYSGGYSAGAPPLPIPNREVKPGRADGTAPQCGRVGRRRFSLDVLPFLWNLCSSGGEGFFLWVWVSRPSRPERAASEAGGAGSTVAMVPLYLLSL